VPFFTDPIRRIAVKFSENSDQAADYLRQAIPMMVKYKIVPNPLNYTLWYSYCSHVFPLLNEQLDKTIKRFGTCPPEIAESLFLRHINKLDKGNKERLVHLQRAFSHIVDGLSDSMNHTTQQTNDYSQALMKNLAELSTHAVDNTIAPVLDKLSVNASAICTANKAFQGQLSEAQSEINRLKSELENSKKEANTDPLTGLYNRRVFEVVYNQFVDGKNNRDEITLIMLDVDKFKAFNDTHGHLVGDQILKYIGQLLKEECVSPTLPVRLGGEEFAVLCPNSKLEQAQAIAENIRVKLASMPFSSKRTGEKIPPVTASFGVAQKRPFDNLSNIIERADEALYAAKNAGRNQVKLAVK
jgi:diguanylate cyclase